MNAALDRFVREAISRGIPRDQIRSALTQARGRPEEIAAAMAR